MSLATRGRPSPGVVAEIAARRRADVLAELAGIDRAELRRRVRAAPPPRPIAERLAAPGLHLIAEIKRSSPSAGPIAAAKEDVVARARAYARGGAAAVSVLCEPHWFGGSVADLTAVRAAVSVPVLAKEFVVEARQIDLLRAAGADVVLLLAVLHRGPRLARLVDRALDIGLEPLVEVHDERELEVALATHARLIGINNRDLRTLHVDPERAVALRASVPEDRLVIAESGVREPSTIRGWRALGFDAALIGEALVRAGDPEAAARAFVAAGLAPTDPANLDRIPFVKICGVTDAAGIDSAVRTGVDAVGLNLVPGTPRGLELREAVALAAHLRAVAPPGGRPMVVAITVDGTADELNAIGAALDADAIQLNGMEPPALIAALERPAWKVLHLPSSEGGAGKDVLASEVIAAARTHLAAGVARIMLDTAGGPHPGGTGVRADVGLVEAVAREVAVTLAGGLHPENVGPALRAASIVGVDVASGVEAPRKPGRRPVKDPFKVALFVKRARASRVDRPNLATRPATVHPGLLAADDRGRWGMERDFGGRYVPETLMGALEQLESAYDTIRHDPRFWAELNELLGRFAGRPTALYRADRLAEAVRLEAVRLAATVPRRGGPEEPPRIRLYLKREEDRKSVV